MPIKCYRTTVHDRYFFRFTLEQHEALLAPIGRLHFAGEAYDANREFGYLQTASASGERVARAVSSCLNATPGSRAFRECTEFAPAWMARGCTYESADNFDEAARQDDGSCSFSQTSDASGFKGGRIAAALMLFNAVLILFKL